MQPTIKYTLYLLILFVFGVTTGISKHFKTIPPAEILPTTVLKPAAPTVDLNVNTKVPHILNRILFTGDINLGRCIAKRTLVVEAGTKNYNYPFQYVAEKLRAADITVGSLDGSLSDESSPMPCPDSFNLIGPRQMVEGLQFSGFDVITIATNHIKDCGEKGFDCDNRAILDTIRTLTEAGIHPVGAGKNLSESRLAVVVERNGIRFAFLGFNQFDQRVWAGEHTPGTAPLSQAHIDIIKAQIVSAKQIADVVIVLPQWGVEYAAEPEDYERSWAKEFIDAGASLVIGNGPHVIQPVEVFSGKAVFFALGNFVFDQEQSFRRESIVVEVDFNGAEIESWQLHPVSINLYTFQPHWAEDEEAEYILARALEK